MNPLATNSSIQCRVVFVKSSTPCAFDPYYTFLSYNFYTYSYFLVARDGVTFNFNFKKHLPFFYTIAVLTPGRIPPSAGRSPQGGDPCRDLESFSTKFGSNKASLIDP